MSSSNVSLTLVTNRCSSPMVIRFTRKRREYSYLTSIVRMRRIFCTLPYKCCTFHFQLRSIDLIMLPASRAKLCDGWYKTPPYTRYEKTLKWLNLINYKCDQPMSRAIIVSQRMKYISEFHVLRRRWVEMYKTHANACKT